MPATGVEQHDIAGLDALRESRDVGVLDRGTRLLFPKIEDRGQPDVQLEWDFVDRLTVVEKMKRRIAVRPRMRTDLDDLFVHALHGEHVK